MSIFFLLPPNSPCCLCIDSRSESQLSLAQLRDFSNSLGLSMSGPLIEIKLRLP